MKSIKTRIRFDKDLEKIVGILDENLISYLEILKEAADRGPYRGWVYNKEALDKYRFTESKHLENHKKKLIILDDLALIGYLNITEGPLRDDDGIIKDIYSIYTRSQKGKGFLKMAKIILESPSKNFFKSKL